MNVLSLFDGISCGYLALQKSKIKINKYYASEIDKKAIEVSKYNNSSIVHIGDVAQWREWNIDWRNIDLLIGGSPCQGFSFSGKQLAFEDPRSKLFFTYVDILNHIRTFNPNVKFLLENVKMKQEFLDIISDHLFVAPIFINSSLMSAQNRQRYYWFNWNMKPIEDKNIKLRDVLDEGSEKLNKGSIIGRRLNEYGKRDDYNKNIPIRQYIEVRATNQDKSNCLTTVEKDNVLTPLPVGRHGDAFKDDLPFRYYSVKEYCKLQTIPTDYFPPTVSNTAAKRMIGNSWTVDVISHLFNCME